MKKGDLVRIRQSGKLAIYWAKMREHRCAAKMLDSMLIHEFAIKDLEKLSEDQ